MTDPRVVFAGTPAFALPALHALIAAGIEPVAVLTQPDRPSGRGRQLSACPVKAYAADRGLVLQQPETLDDDAIAALAALAPDLIVVAAYGLIFPRRLLELPRLGCLNVHASLLPRWRGAAPIQAAILAGDRQTGISLMRMEAGLDTGPVYVSEAFDIAPGETAGDLHDRLAALGGALLARHLDDILAGRLEPEPQDEAQATHAGKIRPDDAVLDWHRPATDLERIVRAYNPVPGTRFALDGETVKCWRAAAIAGQGSPGAVLAAGADGVDVACGDGALRLLELQRPGKRRVSGREFAAQLDIAGQTLPAAG